MKIKKISLPVCLGLCLITGLVVFSCGTSDNSLIDITAPTISSSTITRMASTLTTVVLSWNAATDDVTGEAALLYQLVYSASNNIASIEDAVTNGTVALSYTANTTSATVSGLSVNTNYYFNVLAKDEAGNVLAYTPLSAATSADTTAPTVSSSTITTTGTTSTEISISWNAASDDVTAQASLLYMVVYSESDNIATVATSVANGTVALAYTANANSKTISGLSAGTTYYVNVLAKDAAGNRRAYTSKNEDTVCFLPDTLITLGNGEMRRIDQVRTGDWVQSFDSLGYFSVSKVSEVIISESRSYLQIDADSGSVRTTPGHPFYGGPTILDDPQMPGFRKISLFNVGDPLYRKGRRAIQPTTILRMARVSDDVLVYNLHIASGPETYFANGFAVHNYSRVHSVRTASSDVKR